MFPTIGEVLRHLITASGCRPMLVDIRADKDLDDLASSAIGRQSTQFEILQHVQECWINALIEDCGIEWGRTFHQAWLRSVQALQTLVLSVDCTAFDTKESDCLFNEHFVVPMLSGFLRFSEHGRSSPVSERWWDSPFDAWATFAAKRTGLPVRSVTERLAAEVGEADQRTIERWLEGQPMGKLSWPYKPKLKCFFKEHESSSDLSLLTGWLLITCAFQALPNSLRASIKRDYSVRPQQPWRLGDAISVLKREAFNAGDEPARAQAVSSLNEIDRLLSLRPHVHQAISEALADLQTKVNGIPTMQQQAYQYLHDWYAARYAGIKGKSNEALDLYAKSVAGAWWCSGENQKPILEEALVYAAGLGDKVAANRYWDQVFMLGLNRPPKVALDDQEMRRLSFSFEQRYFPQKAASRIPPKYEIRHESDRFVLDKDKLVKPNQKTKFAEGRTRRMPLMEAILDGTLSDVQSLVNVGADPNDFIPESGEGPLSYAMRRAADRKDPLIMEYLLGLELSKETVNRQASTGRVTPLKTAIEMADADAVSRLIQLGANVEAVCGRLPSALIYAMSCFHESLHRELLSSDLAYFSGKGGADSFDAKNGTVLDVDLAEHRLSILELANASARNQQIRDAVFDYFIRPADGYRKVIQSLLSGGANANRRYRVEAYHLEQWTPTLFAAQVGDLDVFRMLVEYPGPNCGDPELTLIQPSQLERWDALWVAIDHGRHSIASYLMERRSRHMADATPS